MGRFRGSGMFASFLVFHREFASMGPFPPNQCDEKRQDVLIVVGNGNVDILSLLLALFYIVSQCYGNYNGSFFLFRDFSSWFMGAFSCFCPQRHRQ
jgi:hypothetical protein